MQSPGPKLQAIRSVPGTVRAHLRGQRRERQEHSSRGWAGSSSSEKKRQSGAQRGAEETEVRASEADVREGGGEGKLGAGSDVYGEAPPGATAAGLPKPPAGRQLSSLEPTMLARRTAVHQLAGPSSGSRGWHSP